MVMRNFSEYTKLIPHELKIWMWKAKLKLSEDNLKEYLYDLWIKNILLHNLQNTLTLKTDTSK